MKSFLEGERTQFRTQMVNGKPQIYFDALGWFNSLKSIFDRIKNSSR